MTIIKALTMDHRPPEGKVPSPVFAPPDPEDLDRLNLWFCGGCGSVLPRYYGHRCSKTKDKFETNSWPKNEH